MFLCIGVEADARSTVTFLTTKRSFRTPLIEDLRSSMPRAVHPGAIAEPASSPSSSCDSSCDGRSSLKNCRVLKIFRPDCRTPQGCWLLVSANVRRSVLQCECAMYVLGGPGSQSGLERHGSLLRHAVHVPCLFPILFCVRGARLPAAVAFAQIPV